MADQAISDLYERYKSGTKQVVQWVAETANDQRAGAAPSKKPQRAITLSTSELLRLAERIADNANPKRAPPTGIAVIISVLSSVISGRRECATWYRLKAELLARDKDKSHEYFVGVLEAVFGYLWHARERSLAPKPGKQGKQRKEQSGKSLTAREAESVLANDFTRLTVEETLAEDDDEDAGVQQPGVSPLGPAHIEYQLEAQKEDADFALWCMFKECSTIRNFVRESWEAHANGAPGLAIVSEVADKAFALVHLAVDAFIAEFPDLATFPEIAKHLSINVATDGQTVESFRWKGTETGQGGGEREGVAELLCIPAYVSMMLLRARHLAAAEYDVPRMDELDALIEGSHPITDRLLETTEMCDLLMNHVEEWLGSGVPLDVFYHDALMYTKSHRPLPLYAVIDVQIYMDIIDVLGSPSMEGLRYLLHCRNNISKSIAIYENRAQYLLDAEQYPGLAFQTPLRETCKHRISIALGETFERPKGEDFNGPQDWRNLPAFAPLLLNLPVLCGWFVHAIERPSYLDGIGTSNNGFLLFMAAHAYNACQHAGLLKGKWEDMEFLIRTQGPERLRLWSPAAGTWSLQQAAKHYDLALGVDLRQLYDSKHGRKPAGSRIPLPSPEQVNKRAVRFAPTLAYYGSMVEERDGDDGTLENTEPRHVRGALYRMVKKLMADRSFHVDDQIRKQWAATKTLTPVQLLSLLQASLIADELQQAFDYRALFNRCASLMSALKALLQDEVKRDEGC